MAKHKKGVALILSVFLTVLLLTFVGLASYQYTADLKFQRHYENNLQAIYEVEAAKAALLWEQKHSDPVNSWDTVGSAPDSTPKLDGASIDGNEFYSLEGHTFRAKVFNENQEIVMYIHGYQLNPEGQEVGSQYVEARYAPTGMYRYAMFSNQNLTFSGSALHNLHGGSIHSNQNIIFKPSGNGVRFNEIGKMSASGTIAYGQRRTYPNPYIIARLDGLGEDYRHMAPVPHYDSPHYSTATGDLVTPGPFMDWREYNEGTVNLQWKRYGSWVGANWGSYGKVPLIWRGDETYFYGRQTYGSGRDTYERSQGYLTTDGETTNWYSDDKAEVNRIYTDTDGFLRHSTSTGFYYKGDVHFRPAANEQWYQVPGALPEDRNWSKYRYKYDSGHSRNEPVEFYITEKCTKGAAGCIVDTTAELDESVGWRYIKKDAEGNIIGQGQEDELEADNALYESDSTGFVKAQDYETDVVSDSRGCTTTNCQEELNAYWSCLLSSWRGGGSCQTEAQLYIDCYNANNCADATKTRNYFDHLSPLNYDKNEDFFENYSYGDDADNPDSWLTKAFNAEAQTSGFGEYSGLLSERGAEGVLLPGVEQKEPFLGDLFDGDEDSPYKKRAEDSGIYIDENMNIEFGGVTKTLNALRGMGVAEEKSFYNWKTAQEITVLEIDVGKLNEKITGTGALFSKGTPFNNVIYSKLPIRLTNAKDLPGENTSEKNAVFTLIGEESVYLKGNYNTEDWKISNIATPKKVYTLSDEFNDPQEPPDWAIYPEYPYVEIGVDKDEGGKITEYYPPDSSQGTDTMWVNANRVYSSYSGIYRYYHGMDKEVRDAVRGERNEKQSDYVSQGIEPPNMVCSEGSDSCTYTYNSLFITPYDGGKGDHSLENWRYIDSDGTKRRAKKNMVGAFLNFYGSNYQQYKTSLGSEEGAWDYEREGWSYPNRIAGTNNWYIKSRGAGYSSHPTLKRGYDPRFPAVEAQGGDAFLGFTGATSWRLISETYFDNKT